MFLINCRTVFLWNACGEDYDLEKYGSRFIYMEDSLQKAKIIVLGDNDSETESIDVLFNPTEYKINYSSSYKDNQIAGSDLFVTQFSYVEPAEMEVSLFFDQSSKIMVDKVDEAKDVTLITKQFVKLIYVDASLHRPPYVKFQWGSVTFKGVVLSANTEYTMFEKDGMPIQATVSLKIKEVMDIGTESRNKPFESPDRTKCRMVSAGKTIWNIAYEEYGTMEMWRYIAKENKLIDPLNVKNGTILKVPAL